MHQFGMPSLIEMSTIEETAKLCNELGLSFIELSMSLPQYQIDRINIEALRELSAKYNVGYTIHLDENLNPNDFNKYVVDACHKTIVGVIDIAKQLRMPIINMHLPRSVYFTLPDKRVDLFDEYRVEYIESMQIFRDVCERTIGDTNIKICVENCHGYTDAHIAALNVLLESKVFGLTLDIGHSAAAGYIDEPFVFQHIDRLHHMHIHDALGKKNHLPLGVGEIDLHKYFDIAKLKDCSVVLETKTASGLTQSVEWMNNNR